MIRAKQEPKEIVIDLTGPQGNAFYLLGTAKDFAHQLDLDWETVHSEMTSGDYKNLLEVFDSYFGSFVILER
jgi:hypothetical protein